MFIDKNLKSGFTLAEMLIVIGALGVVAAIVIPMFTKSLPSKEEEIHKKMTYLVEQIATQMYDNETFYPKTSDIGKQGFLNTDGVSVDNVQYGGSTDTQRKQKFCKLFARQFNIINNNVICSANINEGAPSFRSTDGVDWWIPQTTFKESSNGQVKGYAKIKIDVNGYDKGSNCAEGDNGCSKPDTFYYYIKTNGSVTLSNPVAMVDRTYKVTLDIVTKDENGNTEQSPGGSVDIAKKGSDEFSNNFDGLDANSYYILRAKPNTGYLSNWKIGDPSADGVEKTYGLKKIYTSKMNTDVEVEFNKIKTYCIKVNANDIGNIDANLYKNCKYKSESDGEYEVESATLGIYKYVGAPNGTHNYSCDENSESFIKYANYIEACGLKPGDYKVEIIPTNGYTIYPDNGSSTYTQNIRLGTSDNEFSITVNPVSGD